MEFDLAKLAPRDAYKLIIGSVVPRPIGWVTTLNGAGGVNAAPYSFFNALSHDPPLLVLGVEAKPDRALKDTARNIHERGEYVVNIVDEALAEAMNVTAISFPAGIDELQEAGLATAPSRQIAPPRIAQAPVSFECRRYVTLEISRARQIVLGQILHIHMRDDLVDVERFYVDPERLRAVGRMGGAGYTRTRDRFEMPRIDVADWPDLKENRR